MITPEKNKKNQESKYNVSQITAGKQFALKQSRILNEKRFLQAFSRQELTKNFQINWQVFQQEEFDSSARRDNFRRIKMNIKKCYKENPFNKQIGKLLDDIKDLVQQEKQVYEKRMLKISLDYFRKYYPEHQYQKQDKKNGSQSGLTLTFFKDTINQNSKIKLFIKTHSQGRLNNANQSSCAKRINVIQILNYQILWHLSLIPNFYFYGRSLQQSYFATQAINKFHQFQKIMNSPLINQESISNELIYLSLIGSILNISDFLTNISNFGIIQDTKQMRVVDFRPPHNQFIGACVLKEDFISNYVKGLQYQKITHKNIIHLLNKQKNIKKKLKQILFQNQLKNFKIIVQQSSKNVLKSIKDNIIIKPSSAQQQKFELQLQLYSGIILDNYFAFMKQLNQ